MYYCYLIVSKSNSQSNSQSESESESNSKIKTYIGITNNISTRLQKHNGIIKGGAKSTRMSKNKNWHYYIIVKGFESKSNAQSFEWYWKHILNKKNKWVKNKPCIENKMKRLIELLVNKRWMNLRLHY